MEGPCQTQTILLIAFALVTLALPTVWLSNPPSLTAPNGPTHSLPARTHLDTTSGPRPAKMDEGTAYGRPTPPRSLSAYSIVPFPPRASTAAYAAGTAPTGIADFGQGPSASVSYTTSSFLGSVSIASLSVCASPSPCGSRYVSVQLNVNLGFTDGGTSYVYWIQDVALINSATSSVTEFEDNIWNFSAPGTEMYTTSVSGYGTIYNFSGPSEAGFYADGFGFPGVSLMVYPGTFQLIVNTSVDANGQPEVAFMFDTGSGFERYDLVTFPFVAQLDYSNGFIVDGGTTNPIGLGYDSELVLGGPGGGSSTVDESSTLLLGLQFWNGHNYETVNNAVNSGEDTGETISNSADVGLYYYSNGSLFAFVSAGTETSEAIWYSSDIAIIGIVGPGSCNAFLEPGSGNVSYLGGTGTIALGPTPLDFGVTCAGYREDLGTYNLSAGSNTTLNAGTWTELDFGQRGLPSNLSWGVSIGTDKQSVSGALLSFYLPSGTYAYRLFGGTGYLPTPSSGVASVTSAGGVVSISWGLLGVTSSAISGSVDVGQQVTFGLTSVNGVGNSQIEWLDLPSGCSSSDLIEITCSPDTNSSYSISVQVSDTNGSVATSSNLLFTVYADPEIDAPIPSLASVDRGQEVAFSVATTPGSGHDTVAWTGLPTGCAASNLSMVSCSPVSVGTYIIQASITDSNGFKAPSPTLSFTVYAPPIVTLTVTPGSVLVSGSVTFQVATLSDLGGGVSYTWSGLPPGCAPLPGSTLTCSPSSSGTFVVSVVATDRNGGLGSGNVSLTVAPTFLGLPSFEGYAVVALVVGLVTAVAIVLISRHRRGFTGDEPPAIAERVRNYSPVSRPSPVRDISVPISEVWSEGARVEVGDDEAGYLDSRFAGVDPGSVARASPLVNPPDPICWHCQFENAAASRYCARCGLPLEPPPSSP